ncbi:MAG: pyrimidine dimer DNA glycosylase/endonuclease V [Candidatus Nanoarchaeia archaeon]|nr:pyrimidine dimer DNA glycosylase/endonuclease V [Candidatus Nanoarchaeia archaeon]
MTRINISIPVKNLTDEHLLSEHREIKRICYNYKIRKNKNKFDDIPKNFKLGRGHVLFFINKPDLTYLRYQRLYNECKNRGFKVQDFSNNWEIYNGFLNKIDYVITPEDQKLIIQRITEKLESHNKNRSWHYYGKPISSKVAIELLNT